MRDRENIRDAMFLLILARQLKDEDLACRILKYSKDEFNRIKKIYEGRGQGAQGFVKELKSDTTEEVVSEYEQAVLRIYTEHPKMGQAQVIAALLQEGIRIKPEVVKEIWIRHGLETAAKRSAINRATNKVNSEKEENGR